MKSMLSLIFVTLCVSVSLIWSAPSISINDSNVPTANYELDAAASLEEAYILYPANEDKRIKSFVDLFTTKHPTSGGWNVAAGCSVLYRSQKNYTYVSLNVNDGNSTSIIKIYN